jgi:hypothetical protein
VTSRSSNYVINSTDADKAARPGRIFAATPGEIGIALRFAGSIRSARIRGHDGGLRDDPGSALLHQKDLAVGRIRLRQAVQELDDIGLAPSVRIIGVAGADDVILATLVEYDMAIFRLQIRSHIGIQKPAANEAPAAPRPLGIDFTTYAGRDMGALLPCALFELGYAHDLAAFRA